MLEIQVFSLANCTQKRTKNSALLCVFFLVRFEALIFNALHFSAPSEF